MPHPHYTEPYIFRSLYVAFFPSIVVLDDMF